MSQYVTITIPPSDGRRGCACRVASTPSFAPGDSNGYSRCLESMGDGTVNVYATPTRDVALRSEPRTSYERSGNAIDDGLQVSLLANCSLARTVADSGDATGYYGQQDYRNMKLNM